ncbi:hypothetical protein niasHS_006557 [Heterodera schachtii]|uniref:G-protein coupled receptors family 1 profile domain-containing protein n=1 Tax=Heterodera schachtii TaxID=97005 RepID=A0ABD2JHK3_HETSC
MASTLENVSQITILPIGDGDCHDECLYFVVDIGRAVPLEYGLPLYGFLMPILVLITTAINSFIVVVLSQRHLRTPTNFVLLAMAVADLLTGLSSIPWFIYYYTLHGFEKDQTDEGLPAFWCRVYPLFSQIIPTIWHTSAIWLSVFLAVQRYVYVCVPSQVHRICTPCRTRRAVATIIMCSVLTELPELFGKYMERVHIAPGRTMCLLRYSAWVRHGVGVNAFFALHYWFRVALVHALPCALLLIFTIVLIRTIRRAEQRRRSWATGDAAGEQNGTTALRDGPKGAEKGSISARFISGARSANLLGLKRTNSWSGTASSNGDGAANGSAGAAPPTFAAGIGGAGGGGRTLMATSKMLTAICTVFLLLELPAAFIFTLHLLLATDFVPNTPHAYRVLNVTLIIRNLLIVFTSPLQFFIYCSMSEQFRLTVRQLFSSRLLFVAQAQPNTLHGGKRYSLVLVDVELIRRQQQQLLLSRKRNLSLQQRRVSASCAAGKTQPQPKRSIAAAIAVSGAASAFLLTGGSAAEKQRKRFALAGISVPIIAAPPPPSNGILPKTSSTSITCANNNNNFV